MFAPPLGYSKPDMVTLPPPPVPDDADAPAPADDAAPDAPGPTPARAPRWLWPVLAGIMGLLILVLFVGGVRAPFYALSPGPVEEVDDITDIAGTPV